MATNGVDIAAAEQALKRYFGFDKFRPAQEPIIASVINGDDVLALMATGGGKSITFQVPALMRPGVCLVISPFVALMKDQVDALVDKGIGAALLNSTLDATESANIQADLKRGIYRFLYVAPERLDSDRFIELLCKLPISFVAIDEAHCVSTMGHDFRPSYLRINRALGVVERRQNRRLQRVALTATATIEVRQDVAYQLGLKEPRTFATAFERKNIHVAVHSVDLAGRNKALIDAVSARRDRSVIIYAATRQQVEDASKVLAGAGIESLIYHAGMSKADRQNAQNRFVGDECEVMVATKAFGTGIDKPNIRCVIHLSMPDSVENYFQEIGRAGRDGGQSESILLYAGERDRSSRQAFIAKGSPPEAAIRAMMAYLAARGRLSATLSPETIAGVVGEPVKSWMADGILSLLEQCGYSKRVRVDAEGKDDYELLDSAATPRFEEIESRRKVANRNLESMDAYCQTGRCRTAFLVSYLGERVDRGYRCGHCDNCAASEAGDGDLERMRIPLKIILSTAEMYSEGLIIKAALGVKDHSMVSRGIAAATKFGGLKHLTQQDVSRIMNMLKQFGLTEQAGAGGPLRVTAKGRKFAGGDNSCVAIAQEGYNGQGSGLGESANGAISEMVARLSEMRAKVAGEHGINASLVLTDDTIKLIATAQPKTKAELAAIHGVGTLKANKIGDLILAQLPKD